ncbi:Lysine--tRNA ligase [Platanthera zijinensis]|uniref:Lysine--tRNA ligase n=1 Tax=Platanthera zijinensis TaxID=2320716 RepID=A0AAP0AVU0_9ASPA
MVGCSVEVPSHTRKILEHFPSLANAELGTFGEEESLNLFFLKRTRLMRQIEQHNEKRATFADQKRENDDYSYDISLDEDFVTALEYGMPPASGMV